MVKQLDFNLKIKKFSNLESYRENSLFGDPHGTVRKRIGI